MEACKFTKISLHNNSAETKKGKNMLYTLPDNIFMNISKKTAVPMSLLEFTEEQNNAITTRIRNIQN